MDDRSSMQGRSMSFGLPVESGRLSSYPVVQSEASSTNLVSQEANVKRMEMKSFSELKEELDNASLLVDDVILKKYLHHLHEMESVPLEEHYQKIEDIRIYKITEMVYQDHEYSTYKLASVFNSVQHLNCGAFIIMDSDSKRTEFYIGVRSLDENRTCSSLGHTLCNALKGQFPGTKTMELQDEQTQQLIASWNHTKIAAVSCVAQNKDADFKDNDSYIQGLEKLALAMQGQRYTAIILAKSTPQEQLEALRHSYEMIYTQLSPFAEMQLSYGTNTAVSISETFSRGTTTGKNWSKNWSESHGSNRVINRGTSHSVTKPDVHGSIAKATAKAAMGVAAIATAPLTGGVSLAVAAGLAAANTVMESIPIKITNDGCNEGESYGENDQYGKGGAEGGHQDAQEGYAKQKGVNQGETKSTQLTLQNRTLTDTLERIEKQLQRLNDCESMGMWECAAYFLSDTSETAEMAAGTYKALIRGEKTGVESSATNFWGYGKWAEQQIPLLQNYIYNFLHPVFQLSEEIHVTAASLVSGNELAIQMGLPRHSVCGFPVIEHAEFGREVVKYHQHSDSATLTIGDVYSMGEKSQTPVMLERDSLTMHTFVTGSTGAGKSNTIYDLLYLLRRQENIPFLVIEPAKGEYKHIFGGYSDVSVYGTNPLQSEILELNPFSFHDSIHVLEHIDRLVEIFNACWPMYAAMPAVLKDAIEQSYRKKGWDLNCSVCTPITFPTFRDLLEELPKVMERSAYSSDTKSDYSGALVTRIHSLTNGINGQVLCSGVMPEQESARLFDHSAVVDLSRVGSSETKSLLMGILVMKLQEYRMHGGKMNAALSHITVLEEAHNLLRRTSTEQSQESSNLQGKSVEMIANAIAEMRTYGEGFIIADQAPGLLDESIIRNTNTKIVLRLPDEEDRVLVGKAMTLTDSQITELTRLPVGVAAVFQNDWIQPVLCQFEAFSRNFQKPCSPYDDTPRLNAIRKFLYRLYEIDDNVELDQEDIDTVYRWLYNCGVDTFGYGFVKDMLVRGRKLNRTEKMKLTGIIFDAVQIAPMMQEHQNQKHIQKVLYNMHRLKNERIAEKAIVYLQLLVDETEHSQSQETPERIGGRVQ